MELWIFVNSRLCIRLYPCGSVVRQMFVLGNSGSTVRLPSVGTHFFLSPFIISVDRHITVGLFYLIFSVFGARRTPQAVPITPRLFTVPELHQGMIRILPCTTIFALAMASLCRGFVTPTARRQDAATSTSTATALTMVKTRGLEVRREGPTPTGEIFTFGMLVVPVLPLASWLFLTPILRSSLDLCFILAEGGMTLYLKAGPDGTSVGDCPFAHFVRMVLEEKGLEYELKPSVQETKPEWLVEFYEGKMPALRHRKECYVESDVIAEYLDFFFRDPPLKTDKASMEAAEEAVAGLFPAIAKYLKHTPDGDDEDAALQTGLEESLTKLNTHLASVDGPFVAGESFSLVDCSLAPKLYHMQTGVKAFKNGSIDFTAKFPAVAAYMQNVFARPSFQSTVYPAEVVEWGWSNARK